MRVAVFSTKKYDKVFLDGANNSVHELVYHEVLLTPATAPLAAGYPAVCAFVNDQLSQEALIALHAGGTHLVALRSAGFNHVDLVAADRLGLTVALVLSLNRRTYRAYNRVREGNFSLEGLLGFDLHGKTVGVIGTGTIGLVFAKIMHGFGCHIVASDPCPDTHASKYVRYC